jgi:WD40 repeat protein
MNPIELKGAIGVNAIAYSPDGSRIIGSTSGFKNDTLLQWDIATGQQISEPIQLNRGKIRGFSCNNDGSQIITLMA